MIQIESLESRRMLSTAGLPSLTGVLTVGKTTISAPGQKVTAILAITNSGGDISKVTVPIGVYASESLVTTLDPSLTIKHGQTKKIPVKVTIPASAVVPDGDYEFTAVINDAGTVAEVPSTNGNASATLFNPLGSYTGTYEIGTDENTLDITIFTSDGKFESSVSVDGSNFGTIVDSKTKTTISNTGKFSAVAIGSNAANQVSKFVVQIKGAINTSTQNISGPFTVRGKGSSGPFKGKGSFNITEAQSN